MWNEAIDEGLKNSTCGVIFVLCSWCDASIIVCRWYFNKFRDKKLIEEIKQGLEGMFEVKDWSEQW